MKKTIFIHRCVFGKIYIKGVILHEKAKSNQHPEANGASFARAAVGVTADHAVVGGVVGSASSELSCRSGESYSQLHELLGVHRRIAGVVGCHGGDF